MNGGKRDNFKVGKYSVDLDLTEVITSVIDAQGKQKEIHDIHWLLIEYSKQGVNLSKVLSIAFPELAKQIPRFFQKRTEDHRRALRVRQLISFKSSGAIEEEAVKRAWEDTRSLIGEVSLMKDESMKGLVDDHREILRRLCDAMIKLVMEKDVSGIDLNVDAVKRFLEG